uniref:Phospholipase A2 n=1 Tax=Strigamia maritima TaxID=126957 RepID=T1JIX8_STRMM
MARMVGASTGQNALDFNDYGNYCGLGGKGVPVDGIDRCCAVHDRCYSYLNKNGCFPYLMPYRYNNENVNNFFIQDETGNACRDITCHCDKELAHCISYFPYNREFKHFPDIIPLIENIVK